MKAKAIFGGFRNLLMSTAIVAMALTAVGTFVSPVEAQAQTNSAVTSGVVRDANGEPIIGANVVEKGTNNGTITDVDGKFVFTATRNATLEISYVGMKTKEVRAAKNMIVNLQEDAEVLDELVVVGYGTQKKANLTGAVSSVDVSKQLESKSESDVAKALQGAVPGLTITNANGDINEDATIVIRGIGTLSNGGTSKPLYIVDGVPVDNLNMLNANDIESISVLKDASSTSIYGTKAAFGVVMITTKTAKDQDKCKVTYSANFGWSQATALPNYPDVPTQVQGLIDVNRRAGLECELFGMYMDSENFQKGMMNAYNHYNGKKQGYKEMVKGIDYDEYGYYTDWDVAGIMFNNAAPSQQHNISVQGNSGKTQYYMSLGYDKKQGLINFNPDKLKRYNATVNLSTQATDWLQVGARFNYSDRAYESVYMRSGTYQYLWRWGSFFGPYGYLTNEDGRVYDGRTMIGYRNTGGELTRKSQYLRMTGFFKVDFLPQSIKNHKFSFNGDYTYSQRWTQYKGVGLPAEIINTWSVGAPIATLSTTSFVESDRSRYYNHNMNAYFNYNGTFGKHNHLNVMVGMNLEKDEYQYLYYERQMLQDLNMPELGLATNSNGASDMYDYAHTHSGSMGFFGRINYDYKGIYLVELNGRVDGSSKFPKSSQWGFFPSASVGYRISEEAYFEKAKEYVSNLKVRASYGTIGNQEVGNNMYLESMSNVVNGVNWLGSGSSKQDYFTQPKLVASTLTWETIATTNVGIDLGFFGNKLNVGFDWFQRDTKNMLAPGKELPSVLGTSAAYENAGSMRSRGWEITLDWRQQFGDWNVYANFNLSDYKTKVTNWDSNNLINAYYTGKEYGEIWGFETDRYFDFSDFNSDNSYMEGVADQTALQKGAFVYGPGDVKFVDQNNDGKIDWGKGTPEDHGDLIKIGNFTPRFQYSFRLGFDWKGIDFDMFFQGVGKRDYWTQSAFVMPMMRGADALYANQTSYITEADFAAGKIDQTKDFPRMWPGGAGQGNASTSVLDGGSYNFYPQTKYLVNAAYLRLKNITLGYTLPRQITRKATLEKVRIYGAINNVGDIVDHMKQYGLDPEINTGVGAYGNGVWGRTEPITRTYSIGLQVEF